MKIGWCLQMAIDSLKCQWLQSSCQAASWLSVLFLLLFYYTKHNEIASKLKPRIGVIYICIFKPWILKFLFKIKCLISFWNKAVLLWRNRSHINKLLKEESHDVLESTVSLVLLCSSAIILVYRVLQETRGTWGFGEWWFSIYWQ